MLPLTRAVLSRLEGRAARPRRVAVVGGGVLGLAAAWALARRGHAVTVLEAGPIPNPAASSWDEGRIIRHAYGTMTGYAAMMPAAFAAWRALFAETGRDRLVPMRAVYVLRSETPWEAAAARTQAAAGLGFREVDPAGLPMLATAGVLRAREVEGSGLLRAAAILGDLAALLPRLGVQLRPRAPVAALGPGGVRLADGTRIAAELVLVAAGAGVRPLLPEAAAAAGLRASLQTLAYLSPPEDLAAAWAEAPMLLCRLPGHATGGAYILPPRDGTRLKLGDYDHTATGDPAAQHPARVALLLEAGARCLKGFDRYRVLETRHCAYVMAPDDRFVLRPLGAGAWLASACSGHGFKLAPLLALGLAAAVEEALDPADLALWAAGREGEEASPAA
jgi:sarcosine oxidase/sarcosine oxidase subunit beta